MKKIFMVITNRCNLRCKYCYYRIMPDMVKTKELSYNDIKGTLRNFRKLNTSGLIITGGEPLIRHDIIKIIDYAFRIGFKEISLNTNGVLLMEKMAKTLGKKKLRRITISLDSDNKGYNNNIRGESQKVIRGILNIVKFKNRYTKIRVVSVITKRNYKHLNKIFRFVKEMGVDDIAFQPVYIPRNIPLYNKLSVDNLPTTEKMRLLKNLKQWAEEFNYLGYLDFMGKFLLGKKIAGVECQAHKTLIPIDPDGDVYACFNRRDLFIGNVKTMEASDILQKKRMCYDKMKKLRCLNMGCVCFFKIPLKSSKNSIIR